MPLDKRSLIDMKRGLLSASAMVQDAAATARRAGDAALAGPLRDIVERLTDILNDIEAEKEWIDRAALLRAPLEPLLPR